MIYSKSALGRVTVDNVRLEEVAREAGVSISTVSRALRGDTRISRATSERVRTTATRLGYSPNMQARALSAQRTHNIGIIIANPVGSSVNSDQFFLSVIDGASRVVERLGYNLVVSITPAVFRDRSDLPQMLSESRVDGAILGGIPMDDAFVRAVARCGVPAVFVGRYLEGDRLNMVMPDNVEGGRLAAEHLLGLGHRRIATLCGPLEINTFKDREHGAQLAAAAVPNAQLVRIDCPTFDEASGYRAVRALLQGGQPRLTAILGWTDWLALGAVRALRDTRLAVPGDVSVMGYSDIALATVSDPPLTTVRSAPANLGALAGRLALGLISGEVEGPVKIVLPPEVVVRASCAGPRGGKA
jgi:DNA-binding LacI/PurR family transcriptional regulator